jgi:hypothetical protein
MMTTEKGELDRYPAERALNWSVDPDNLNRIMPAEGS